MLRRQSLIDDIQMVNHVPRLAASIIFFLCHHNNPACMQHAHPWYLRCPPNANQSSNTLKSFLLKYAVQASAQGSSQAKSCPRERKKMKPRNSKRLQIHTETPPNASGAPSSKMPPAESSLARCLPAARSFFFSFFSSSSSPSSFSSSPSFSPSF